MLFAGLTTRYVGDDFSGEQKFVVSRHPTESGRLNLFEYFSVDLWPGSDEDPSHELIVQGFKLRSDDVLGGGRVRRASTDEVLLYGSSTAYGGVPRNFLEFFKNDILKGYQTKFPEIKAAVIDTPETTENDAKVSFLKNF